MKITLLHPSRWRATQARQTLDFWISRAECPEMIQHILSLDDDDDQIDQYKNLFPDSEIHIDSNQNVVQATNAARHLATGEIIIYLSDDFQCPDYWDRLIVQTYLKQGHPDCWLVRVDDLLQKTTADVLTIPIMSKKINGSFGIFLASIICIHVC
jgi:glycosyltransferase involved in cell wall biosynthesis